MKRRNKLDSGISDGKQLDEPFGSIDEDDKEYNIFYISFDRAKDLLTEKRMEMLEKLSNDDFDSITSLTEELDRDKKNISEDIKELYENGLINIKQDGRRKVPSFDFEKIEIESIVFEENISNKERDVNNFDNSDIDSRLEKFRESLENLTGKEASKWYKAPSRYDISLDKSTRESEDVVQR